MILDGAIKAPTLIRFLERLVRDAGRKVFLILDRLQVHRARLGTVGDSVFGTVRCY
jgi:hypothetical protein